MFIPPLRKWVVIFISSLFIFTSTTWINPCRCRPLPTLKLNTGWRGHALNYWLVRRCCHRPQQRPPRMAGSLSPPSHCKKAWNWRRRSVHVSIRAIEFCHWLAKLMGGCKKIPSQDFPPKNDSPYSLTGEMYQADQDSFTTIIFMTSYNCCN